MLVIPWARHAMTCIAAVASFAIEGTAPGQANSITFDLNTVFGASGPQGGAPHVTATFTDVGRDIVRLVFSASGLPSGDFLSNNALLFNFDFFPKNLTASFVSGQKGAMSLANDGFTVGGEEFDARLGFSSKGANRLTSGEKSVWRIKGVGLSTADILALSLTTGKSETGLEMASLVRGNGLGAKFWLTTASTSSEEVSAVPIPATAWLFASAVGGLFFLKRRAGRKGVELLQA